MNAKEYQQILLERDICKTQAAFYRKAALDGCDMKIFSDRYMTSSFRVRNMEVAYSPCQREDAETCLEFIYPKIGFPNTMPYSGDGEIFSPDVAWWVGYTYQQLFYETGVKGTELVVKVPFEKLILNYPAHHTLEETASTDMLCEYYGLEKDQMHKEIGLDIF